MIYHCDRCRGVLTAGAKACPACGRTFDDPVPADAEAQDAPIADLLRGRTVGGPPKTDPAVAGPDHPPGALPPPPYAAVNAPSPRRTRNVLLAGALGLVAFLGLGVWGASALWTQGPGGEMEYRQHNLAGNTAVERGDYGTGDAEYGRMIALRPRRVDGYLLRGISEGKEGLYTEAIADDTAALALAGEPEMRGDLLHNRGEGYANRGSMAPAIADFNASNAEYARVRDPRLVRFVPDRMEDNDRDLAEDHWQRKEYVPAIAAGDAVVALGHPRPTDYGVRGKAEAALGQDAAAGADFEAALRLDPSYVIAYTGLADIAAKAHGPSGAVAVYARATRAEPGDAGICGNLGWFQYEAGQTAAAIATDRRAQSLDPRLTFVAYNLGLAYAAAGQGPQARAAYADALARSGDADRRAGLGDIRSALSRQPGSATLRQALAQVEGGAGAPGAVSPVPAAAARPAPRPPAAFASSLAPEMALGDYGIQPPAGYTLSQSPAVTLSSNGTDYVWAGPRRPDGTVPTLEVVISEDGGRLAAHETSRQVTAEALADAGDNHTHLVTSGVTDCSMGGIPFARGDWAGVGTVTGKSYQGDEYWSVSPTHILHLSTHDAAPYGRDTLPLLRASIATFRRT